MSDDLILKFKGRATKPREDQELEGATGSGEKEGI